MNIKRQSQSIKLKANSLKFLIKHSREEGNVHIMLEMKREHSIDGKYYKETR